MLFFWIFLAVPLLVCRGRRFAALKGPSMILSRERIVLQGQHGLSAVAEERTRVESDLNYSSEVCSSQYGDSDRSPRNPRYPNCNPIPQNHSLGHQPGEPSCWDSPAGGLLVLGAVGPFLLWLEMITHLPIMGSFLTSGIISARATNAKE
jgi:hypothetical protein